MLADPDPGCPPVPGAGVPVRGDLGTRRLLTPPWSGLALSGAVGGRFGGSDRRGALKSV